MPAGHEVTIATVMASAPRQRHAASSTVIKARNLFIVNPCNMVRTRTVNENGPTPCCRPAFAWALLTFLAFPSALYVQQAFGGYTAGSLEQIQNTRNLGITLAIMPSKPRGCAVCARVRFACQRDRISSSGSSGGSDQSIPNWDGVTLVEGFSSVHLPFKPSTSARRAAFTWERYRF